MTKKRLSRNRILQTALGIIDQDGIDALSMRRLGLALGVDPMAVYHHVPNKAALFDGLNELLWSGVELEHADTEKPWREQIADAMIRFRDNLAQHPRAVPIVATRSIATPGALRLIEHSLVILREQAGMTPGAAFALINTLAAFTIGHFLANSADTFGGEQNLATVQETAAEFPVLTEALSETEYDPARQFREATYTILAGWNFTGAVS